MCEKLWTLPLERLSPDFNYNFITSDMWGELSDWIYTHLTFKKIQRIINYGKICDISKQDLYGGTLCKGSHQIGVTITENPGGEALKEWNLDYPVTLGGE